jgi:hypothetical protein
MDASDDLKLLLALAEYLPIKPKINEADRASAETVSATNDFFMFESLIMFYSLLDRGIEGCSFAPDERDKNSPDGRRRPLLVNGHK